MVRMATSGVACMVAPPQAWWPLRKDDGRRRKVITTLPWHDDRVTKSAALTASSDICGDDSAPQTHNGRGKEPATNLPSQSIASSATPRTPAALIADGDDDDNGRELITPMTHTKHATYAYDDDDDVCPASEGDMQSMVSPAQQHQRALPVDDDDDDVCPARCAEREAVDASVEALVLVELARVRNSAAPGSGTVAQRAEAEARVVRQREKDEARLSQAQAGLQEAQERLQKAELELAMCEADERSMDAALSESMPPSQQGSVLPPGMHHSSSGEPCEALLRARSHLNAEKARRQTASAEAMGRFKAAALHLDIATAQLSKADKEAIETARVERELANASSNAWAQVHLARVRESKQRQRAEAEARSSKQRSEEEARQQQARARLEEARERLRQSELELAVCEVDERAVEALMSALSESNPIVSEPVSTNVQASGDGAQVMTPPVRQGPSGTLVLSPYGSSSPTAEVDDELSLDADELSNDGRNVAERIADARRRLATEQARREAALAKTETQREAALEAARARVQAATAQLAEIAAEATVAAQEKMEAEESAMRAWSQVHVAHERMTGTAAQRAAVEASAARQRAEEESRLRKAKAKVTEVQKRMRQIERKLAMCKAEEKSLNEPVIASETLQSTRSSRQKSSPPVTKSLPFVAEEEIVVKIGATTMGRISTSPLSETTSQHAREPEPVSMASRSEAMHAKKIERLQRARRQLDAERARGREAALETLRARHEDAPAASMARMDTSTAQLADPEVGATAAAQADTGAVDVLESAGVMGNTASPSVPLARAWDGGPQRGRESVRRQSRVSVAAKDALRTPSSLSLVPRRRVVVDPFSASCTQQPPDRRGSPHLKSRAQFQAQQWLSTALSQAEDPEDDTMTT